jgi:hypothetical protein
LNLLGHEELWNYLQATASTRNIKLDEKQQVSTDQLQDAQLKAFYMTSLGIVTAFNLIDRSNYFRSNQCCCCLYQAASADRDYRSITRHDASY